jgi:hypothetical protein
MQLISLKLVSTDGKSEFKYNFPIRSFRNTHLATNVLKKYIVQGQLIFKESNVFKISGPGFL